MTAIIALTGPPAGGKSTICGLFEDLGVPAVSTGDGVRDEAARRYDDPDEDDIWDVAESLREEHGPAGPTIACRERIDEHTLENDIVVVSDLRDQAEVEWLTDEYGRVLVIQVDTRNPTERTRRYVDREVANLGTDEPVPVTRERELRAELYERERREGPYPRHHVTLLNDDVTRTEELLCRIEGLCSFVDPDGTYSAGVDCDV